MSSIHYILDKDKNVTEAADLYEWAKFFDNIDHRRVEREVLPNGLLVSTVFLGLDRRFFPEEDGDKRPIVFETMVFTPKVTEDNWKYSDPLYQERCCTWDEAVEMHKRIVSKFTQKETEDGNN